MTTYKCPECGRNVAKSSAHQAFCKWCKKYFSIQEAFKVPHGTIEFSDIETVEPDVEGSVKITFTDGRKRILDPELSQKFLAWFKDQSAERREEMNDKQIEQAIDMLLEQDDLDAAEEEEIEKHGRVIDHQYDLIKDKYGEKAAKEANYGWGATENEIATKVYVSPTMVLITRHDDDYNITGDEWESY